MTIKWIKENPDFFKKNKMDRLIAQLSQTEIGR